tara:strand:- start:443 stop:787 length:345 start_codon:yes stop_codon:yes gene_type:complete
MKITSYKRKKVMKLRAEGLSYAKIAKATKISQTSVIKIVKEHQPPEEPDSGHDEFVEAKILKTCPNPRIILVYFNNDKSDFAKCVVRAGLNYPRDKVMTVKRVDESDERIYRAV